MKTKTKVKLKNKNEIACRVYNTRHMPVTLHDKLDVLAATLQQGKEVVVNQALEIGVAFLNEALAKE